MSKAPHTPLWFVRRRNKPRTSKSHAERIAFKKLCAWYAFASLSWNGNASSFLLVRFRGGGGGDWSRTTSLKIEN